MSRPGFILLALCGAAMLLGSMAADAASDYLVADYGSNSVLRYDASGGFVGVFASVTKPTTVFGDASGNVYVGSYGSPTTSSLLRYDSAGNLTKTYTTTSGWIAGVIVDSSGTVYASDNQNNAVLWFKPDDTAGVLPLGTQTLTTPGGLALDSQNQLYLASNGHILRWDASRTNVTSVVGNPNVKSVAIVDLGGGAEAIRAARSDGQAVGYFLGWDISGGWTGPYVETQGVPQWLNSMLIPDLTVPTSFLMVGSTGIISYDISVYPYATSTLIPIGLGGLSAPYGITQLVPEPGSLMVLAGACAGLAGLIRRRRV